RLGLLSRSGAGLLVATLDGIEDGTVQAVPQPAEGVSFAPKITPAEARVDWKLPAHVVDRQVRACTPDPGAWTELDGVRLKLGPVAPGGSAAPPDLAPGELQVGRHAVLAGTGSHPVLLGDVQAPGKRRMTAPEWARGLRSGGPVRFGWHARARPAARRAPPLRPGPPGPPREPVPGRPPAHRPGPARRLRRPARRRRPRRLRQPAAPGAARRARPHRPGRRLRHRTDLRHTARPRQLRRHPGRLQRP